MGFWSDLWRSIATTETAQERAERRGAEKRAEAGAERAERRAENNAQLKDFRANVYRHASGGQASTGPQMRQWQRSQPGYVPRTNPFTSATPTPATSVAKEEEQARMASEQTPQLSNANYQVLEALGWDLPEREDRKSDLSLLDMSNSQDLADFSYSIDIDELSRMTETYQGQPGFKAPREAFKTYEDDERLKVRSGVEQAAPMTWEAYQALDEDKKRAVDFNTLFIKAREKDLAGEHTPSKEDKAEYAEQYRNIFGRDVPENDTYAPNVVRMLDKIGFKAEGQDLDEYLAGEHLITMDELDTFDASKLDFEELTEGPTVMAEYGDNNYAVARGLENLRKVDAALVEAAGSFIAEAYETNPDAWDFSSALSYEFFGTPPEGADVPWGFGRDEMRGPDDDLGKDDFFRKQYAGLRALGDVDLMWADIEQSGMSEEDKNDLFRFMDLKTRRDIQMGLIDPGTDEAMGAADIRALLGFEEVG